MRRFICQILPEFILSILLFWVYYSTLSVGLFPGESANLIVQCAGIFPKADAANPLWWWLVLLCKQLPFSDLATKTNLLSAVFGVLSVWLLYRLVKNLGLLLIERDDDNEGRISLACTLAGLASAAYMAFSIPFWIVANRAHPAAFHVFLLVLAAHLFLLYGVRKRVVHLILLTFLYGAGIAEFATFIVFLPPAGLLLLFLVWRNEHLRTMPLIGAIISGMLGLSVYLLGALTLYASKSSLLDGDMGVFSILWGTWRSQLFLIAYSLPRQGWIMVLLLTFVPWAASAGMARRALNGENGRDIILLHLILTLTSILVLFNVPFSPWSLLGFRRLLVTPYLLAAVTFGYLIAYWFLLPKSLWAEPQRSWQRLMNKWLGPALILPMIGILCIAPFRNVSTADAGAMAFVDKCADNMLRVLDQASVKSGVSRKWLISDGSMDSVLLVKAYEKGMPLKILSARGDSSETYLKYVSSLFDSVHLRYMARMGVISLVKEWLLTDPEAVKQVAVQWPVNLITDIGYTVVPHGMLCFPAKVETLDANSVWEQTRPVFRDLENILDCDTNSPSTETFRSYLIHMLSVSENNSGVLQQDLGNRKHAVEAYQKARELWDANISALVNLAYMAREGEKVENADAILKDEEESMEVLKGQSLMAVASRCGQIRSPYILSKQGYQLAMGGLGDMASRDLNRAMGLTNDKQKDSVKHVLAHSYMLRGDYQKSAAIYEEMLRLGQDEDKALTGLAMMEFQKRDYVKAQTWLDKAERKGASTNTVLLLRSQIMKAMGKEKEAADILSDLTKSSPGMTEAWIMLADLKVEAGDVTALTEILFRITNSKVAPYAVFYVEGRRALLLRDWDAARKAFEAVSMIRPDMLMAREILLKLSLQENRYEGELLSSARKMLQRDPRHYLANYCVGAILAKNGEYGLAEEAFRISLLSQKTPLALNGMARIAGIDGRIEDAEKLALESISLNKDISSSWDTLGLIQMEKGSIEDAERSFEKALSLNGAEAPSLLHMGALQFALNRSQKAREFIKGVERKALIFKEDQDKLKELRKKLK